MDEHAHRLFAGLCLLVLIWIGVYWLWTPGGSSDPKISFQETSADSEDPAGIEGAPPMADNAPAATAPPGPLALEPPRFYEYVIRSGDTLGSIAERELGSAQHWEAIARANPLKDPSRLEEGHSLRVPVDPGNIQGRVVNGAGRPVEEPPPPPRPVEYTVQPNDTLSGIAKAFYGSTRHAGAIFAANRDRLETMDAIRAGDVLLIPPVPGSAAGARPG